MTIDTAQFAKKTLAGYVPQINRRLAAFFDKEISLDFGFSSRQKTMVRELLEHSKEHNLRASKRLRGSFVHYGYLLSGKEINNKVWQAAMGVEIVHTALLMHDDFMDRDKFRRGGLTTHNFLEKKYHGSQHFGQSMAVSIGDAILCLGFEMVFGGDSQNKTMHQLFRGIVNTAFGQAYDVLLETFEHWTEDDVITLHKAKTAIYTYHNPLVIGANLAGIDNDQVLKIIYDYSVDGGVAFQLQDDILGVFGTPERTGKSADSDLLQGKCTLMVLHVLEKGTAEQKNAVKKIWGKQKASRIDLDAAKKAIMDSGSYDYNKQMAKDFARKAVNTAAKLRDVPGLNKEAIDYIQGIAQYMVTRDV